MIDNVKIKKVQEKQLITALNLAERVFTTDIAPYFSVQGRKEFLSFLYLEFTQKRLNNNHQIYTAELNSQIIGMIEIKNYNHICLLFVDKPFQRNGIG